MRTRGCRKRENKGRREGIADSPCPRDEKTKQMQADREKEVRDKASRQDLEKQVEQMQADMDELHKKYDKQ